MQAWRQQAATEDSLSASLIADERGHRFVAVQRTGSRWISFVNADHPVFSISEVDTSNQLRTAYVTFGSELIGMSMTECDFEQKNNVALIAVARQGKRVEGQPREIKLEAGDTLLLECPPKGEDQLEQTNRRLLTFFDSHFVPQLGKKTITSAVILVLMFIISSFHMLPLMATTMLAAGVMMILGCCRITNVTKYIEWELLLILGATENI